MNLAGLFESLSPQLELNDRAFSVTGIPSFSNFMIGCDAELNPVLLIAVTKPISSVSYKNFRFKYIQVLQNVECKVIEKGNNSFGLFTVIKFISNDENLRKYFLGVSETLVKSIGPDPTHERISRCLNTCIEIFKSLSDGPISTVQGLWSELFIITSVSNPEEVIDSWHNLQEEKFDFAFRMERLEVKSSASMNRIHFFSAEQLNPEDGIQVFIASLFTKQSSSGLTIQDLIERIQENVSSIDLKLKLDGLVAKILGSSLEQSLKTKFDYEMAKGSLKVYPHQSISKIESVNIPSRVSSVTFRSDLSIVRDIPLHDLGSAIFHFDI